MSHPQSRFARVRRLDRVTLSAVVAVAAVPIIPVKVLVWIFNLSTQEGI